MADDTTKETGMTVITIPAIQTQAVLDFVATWETQETDVTGHMLSTGAYGGIGGGALAEKSTSSTNCKISRTGTHGTDFTCSDTDTIDV